MTPFALINFFFALSIILLSHLDWSLFDSIGLAELSGVVNDPVGHGPDSGIDATAPPDWPFLASMLAVFIFYFSRFSEWTSSADPILKSHPTRFYTTRNKYVAGASFYGLIMVAFFAVSYQFPEYFLSLASQFEVATAGPSSNATEDLLAFFLAFFLVIWPKIPSADDSIRSMLHTNARIPLEADSIVSRVLFSRDTRVRVDPRTVDRVLGTEPSPMFLKRTDFENSPEIGQDFNATVAWAGYILMELNDLRGDPRYLDALKKQEAELNEANNEFAVLTEMAASRPFADSPDERKTLLRAANELLKRIHYILVFSVLLSEGSNGSNPKVFLRFGIVLKEEDHWIRPDKNVITSVALALFIGVFLPLVVFTAYTFISGSGVREDSRLAIWIPGNWPEAAAFAVEGALIHLTGVVAGIMVIRSAMLASISSYAADSIRSDARGVSLAVQQEPSGHMYSYFMAFCIAFSFCIYLVALGGFQDIGNMVRFSWPWAFVPGVTASFTAANLVYISDGDGRTGLWRRVAVQAAITGLVALIVSFVVVLDPGMLMPAPDAMPFLIYCFGAAAIIGGVAGFSILVLFRRLRDVTEARALQIAPGAA